MRFGSGDTSATMTMAGMIVSGSSSQVSDSVSMLTSPDSQPDSVTTSGAPNAPISEPVSTQPSPSARRLGGYMSAAASRIWYVAPIPSPNTKMLSTNSGSEVHSTA